MQRSTMLATRRKFKIAVFAASLACAALPGATAHAQTTSRPITLIVAQPGGASPDVMARIIAGRLGPFLDRSVIIENKPGGGNVIGSVAAARAAPDGMTFYFATSAALVLNPFLMNNLAYDPLKDFKPVAFVARSNQLVVAAPDLPVKTLADLIKLDRNTPGKISLAVDGPRNLAGIIGATLNLRAPASFVLVPYNNINSAVQDVMAGRVAAGVFSISIVEALTRDGKLRALALVADRPAAALPGVPLANEAVPGLDFGGWFMIVAPAAIPDDLVAKINSAVRRAMTDPAVTSLAPKLGFDLDNKGLETPAEARAFLEREYGQWRTKLQSIGLKPQ